MTVLILLIGVALALYIMGDPVAVWRLAAPEVGKAVLVAVLVVVVLVTVVLIGAAVHDLYVTFTPHLADRLLRPLVGLLAPYGDDISIAFVSLSMLCLLRAYANEGKRRAKKWK